MSRKNVNSQKYSPHSIEYNDDNFGLSVLSLVLTVTLALLFVALFTENGKLPGGLFGFLVGLTVYFAGFVLSLFTTVTSLIGFLLGHSSIKCFETKRKRILAIIVTCANFVTLIGSVICLIHFSWIFI